MSAVVVIARVITAAVFAVAGLAKLATPSATRTSIAGFGVPQRFAVPGAVLLPVVEIGVAVLVAVPATSWWGALPALVLLSVFSAAVAVNLGRGRTPDCRCFGSLLPSPVGPRLLLRNLALAVPVLVVLFAG